MSQSNFLFAASGNIQEHVTYQKGTGFDQSTNNKKGNMKIFNYNFVVVEVSRITVGPEVGNCQPVLISFKKFKDREEVWKKSHMLQGSGKVNRQLSTVNCDPRATYL